MCAELGIPYIDMAKPDLCSRYELFADPLHLNDVGAAIFSAKVARDSCFLRVVEKG